MRARAFRRVVSSNSRGTIEELKTITISRSGNYVFASIDLDFHRSYGRQADSFNRGYQWTMRLYKIDKNGNHSVVGSRSGYVAATSSSHRDFNVGSNTSGERFYLVINFTAGTYYDGNVWTQPGNEFRTLNSWTING